MVDFAKIMKEEKAKGKFLGYCEKCDTKGRIHEVDVLTAYKDLP